MNRAILTHVGAATNTRRSSFDAALYRPTGFAPRGKAWFGTVGAVGVQTRGPPRPTFQGGPPCKLMPVTL
jgi:hypothetical protein